MLPPPFPLILTNMLFKIRRKLNPIFIQIIICVTAISDFVIGTLIWVVRTIFTKKALSRVFSKTLILANHKNSFDLEKPYPFSAFA